MYLSIVALHADASPGLTSASIIPAAAGVSIASGNAAIHSPTGSKSFIAIALHRLACLFERYLADGV